MWREGTMCEHDRQLLHETTIRTNIHNRFGVRTEKIFHKKTLADKEKEIRD